MPMKNVTCYLLLQNIPYASIKLKAQKMKNDQALPNFWFKSLKLHNYEFSVDLPTHPRKGSPV